MSYATIAQLKQVGVNADALVGISDPDLQAALDSASSMADGYLATRFTLPLVAPYPADLIQHTAGLAAYLAIRTRGFDPNASPSVRMGYEDAVGWLKDISRNLVHPQVTESSSSGNVEPIVLSNPPRRW